MYRIGLYLAVFVVSEFMGVSVFAQHSTMVRGSVKDEKGQPLAYVNVFFKDGDFSGDVSNDSGNFEIETSIVGDRTLYASMIGYDKYEKKINVPYLSPISLILLERSYELGDIQIEASSYTGGEGKVAVSKLDVYTTPGGAADVFQSIKVLPGVTQTDETAALPVRGGSPSENLIMFNGATLAHPFRSENTAGNGLFSIVETAVMKKLYFSSGGFSVKYGNALSGVLDIETDNSVSNNRLNLDANLVSAGVGLQRQIVKDKLSFQVYGKKTSTELLFKLNEPSFDVVQDPVSSTVTGIVNYKYSASGRFQLLSLLNDDAQKFDIVLQSNSNRYRLQSGHQVTSVQWSDFFSRRWFVKSSVSYSAYRNQWSFGKWRRDNNEFNIKWRWDNTYEISSKAVISFGSEVYQDSYDLNFALPRKSGEFYNGADSVVIKGKDHAGVIGNYAEWQNKVARLWTVSIGVRQEYQNLAQSNTFDIRGAVVHELSKTSFLRFAAGTFHQYPSIILYDKTTGNPKLKPMEATHYVVGYEKEASPFQFKLECYYKAYSHLPLEDAQEKYISKGKGYARGVDIFLKGNIGTTSGWISYSFIDTRRKEMDIATVRPSIYDITHNLKIVTKTNLGKNFELAATRRYATGRSYTPIISGTYASQGQYWIPVYGTKNSKRFPTYKRLDARISKLIFFDERKLLVLYVEALNILGNKNILDYSYSEDFSSRDEIKSYFSNRTIVMGFSLNL